MDKEIIIQASRCTIVLYEKELFQLLATKPDLFEKAISRGKGYRRAQACENRLKSERSKDNEV